MAVSAPDHVEQVEDAPGPDEGQRRASRRPMVAGALAALWALLVGIALVTVLVMLVWAVSPNSAGDSAAAWRAAGMTWLGAHLVPLTVSGASVTLLPIGGLLLGLLLTRRGGGWVARMLPDPSAGEAAAAVLGAFLSYGAGGAAIAWLAAGQSASAEPVWAFLVTGALAAGGTLWGLARRTGLVQAARARVRDSVWRTATAGLVAVVGMVGVGAALVSASLIRHFGEVAGTLGGLDARLIGSAGLTLLGALSLPNLSIWAMSLLVGPGFELGRIGGLSAFGGEVESLPALPVLAAIPASVPAWAPALLAVPVALGGLAGRVRWGRDLPTLTGALMAAGGVAGVVAALVAALGWLSGGSLGGGRLSAVGPLLLPFTAAATGLVVLGFLGQAGLVSLRLSWELHRAERRLAGGRGVGPRSNAGPDVIDLSEPAGAADSALAAGATTGAVEAAGVADPGRQAEARSGDEPGPVCEQVPDDDPGARQQGPSRVVGRVGAAGAAAVTVVTGAGGSVVSRMGSVGSAALARVGSVLPGSGQSDGAGADAVGASAPEPDAAQPDADGSEADDLAAADPEVADPEVADREGAPWSESADLAAADREGTDREAADSQAAASPAADPAGVDLIVVDSGSIGSEPAGDAVSERLAETAEHGQPRSAASAGVDDDTDEIPVIPAPADS